MASTVGVQSVSDNQLSLSLRKSFDDFSLDVQADIPLSGATAIFGPSGSGKSTLLRLVSGFEKPDSGTIRAGESIWCDTQTRSFLNPHKRPVGYVFQD